MPEHPTDAHFSFTFVFKQALNQGKHLSNDPLELRTRIRIYFRDGDIVTGFASSTSLDILNYRYYASTLTSLIWDYAAYFPQDNLLRNK